MYFSEIIFSFSGSVYPICDPHFLKLTASLMHSQSHLYFSKTKEYHETEILLSLDTIYFI